MFHTSCMLKLCIVNTHGSYVFVKPDNETDHHDDSEKKVHLDKFDDEAENMIKTVKQALANGEGCRVWALHICNFFYTKTLMIEVCFSG